MSDTKERHVRWAEQLVSSLEDDSNTYLPPTPVSLRTPILLPSIEDDSSQVDSASPSTPPLELPPLATDLGARTSPILIHTTRRPRSNSVTVANTQEGQEVPCNTSPAGSGLGGNRLPATPINSSPLSPRGQAQRRSSIVSPTRSRFDQVTSPILHKMLANSSRATLIWNVLDRPSNDTVLARNEDRTFDHVPATYLMAPATSPIMKEMRIFCLVRTIWDPLTIKSAERRSIETIENKSLGSSSYGSPRSSSSRGSLEEADYVTVKDVIEEIFAYLNRRVTRVEYDKLASIDVPGYQDAVAGAFYKRCDADDRKAAARSPPPSGRRHNVRLSFSRRRRDDTHIGPIQSLSNSPSDSSASGSQGAATARSGGLRRVDCLLNQTQFLKLEPAHQGSGEWIVRFGPPGS